ncbi:hypothetical protein GY45DRAFT_1296000 [Cubamyces sp. BRFM 1775]|nr:hypothetical protein GY45DRAFT_1296000 [Cubamyces sp. BRFM 1775]
MQKPITFYDIPSNVKGTSWSGNTLKTKLTLNYKRLQYETVWVEYPLIARTCQELNVAPTGSWPDGSPQYTLPMIFDPNTNTAIADSANIARYLDKTYPDTPRVIPEGSDAVQEATVYAVNTAIASIMRIVMPVAHQLLNDASKAHFKQHREMILGGNMEEWSPLGSSVRAEQFKQLEKGFGQVAQWLDAGGKQRKYFMGDDITFVDIALAARLLWMKRVLGDDSDEWKSVENWHGGRWARLVAAFEWL